MNLRDHLQLQVWLAARVPLCEVEAAERVGLVGNVRFSEDAVHAYQLLWRWSAVRPGDGKQARFVKRCGQAALDRRIARCRARIERMVGRPMGNAQIAER